MPALLRKACARSRINVCSVSLIDAAPSDPGVERRACLLLTRTELSLIALIGIILLIGIVKKNAIMMIDFALAAERNDGKSSRDAIFQACMLRFRPILMTTMAAMLEHCRWRSALAPALN